MDEWTDHDCTYPELDIVEDEEGGELRAGMKVLIPCPTCGDTPQDLLERTQREIAEADAALLQVEPRRMLYHWAPAARRKQILRYGLRPRMRATTSTPSGKAPVICLGDSPSWAWALSGNMRWSPAGEWDLWQTSLDMVENPIVLASDTRASGIHEVRTQARIFKRNIWYVATRVKPAT